jgi:hypothetical protein
MPQIAAADPTVRILLGNREVGKASYVARARMYSKDRQHYQDDLEAAL